MSLPNIFDPSKPHRCPLMHPNPLVCRCTSCEMARQSAASKAALARATAKKFCAHRLADARKQRGEGVRRHQRNPQRKSGKTA